MNYTLYWRPVLAFTDSRLPLAFQMGSEAKEGHSSLVRVSRATAALTHE